MFKRVTVVLAVLLFSLIIFVPVAAQDGLELDATYEDAEGYFSFDYPSSWITYTNNRYDPAYASFSGLIRDDLGYSVSFSGLLYDSQMEANGYDPSTGDLTPVLPSILRRFGMSEYEEFLDPTQITLGDYTFAEIIAITTDSSSDDGSRFIRTVGILDLGNGYYALASANFVEEDMDDFMSRHATGLAIIESLRFDESAFPPAVPFEFDPNMAGNTDILDESELVMTHTNMDDSSGPSLQTPIGYDGSVYSTDFSFYLPNIGDIYGPELYGLFLEAGEDYNFEFEDAADFLAQDFPKGLQTYYPPFVEFEFVTGINAFEFDNGTYADVVFRNTRPTRPSEYYSVEAIFVSNDGQVIAVQMDIYDDYVEANGGDVFAPVAELRAMMRSFSFEAGEVVPLDIATLSDDPRAIADTALLNSSYASPLGDYTITFLYPAAWSADNFTNELVSLYSNDDQFGENEESLDIEFLLLPDDFLAQLNIESGMSSTEAAEAAFGVVPAIDESFETIHGVETFEFDGFTFAEFIYGYPEDEYFYIEAVGFVAIDDQFFAFSTSLRTSGVDELPAFNQANSIMRAVISTMTFTAE